MVPDDDGKIPDPKGKFAQPLAVKGSPQQGRNHVMGGPQQGGAYKAKDDDVGMHGADSAKNNPGDVAQKVRRCHMHGIDKARRGSYKKPESRGKKEGPDGSVGVI